MFHTAEFALRGPLNTDMQEDERRLTAAYLARRFSRSGEEPRLSYASHVFTHLSASSQPHRLERRQLTVLHCAIANALSIMQTSDAEDVYALMQAYYTACIEVV